VSDRQRQSPASRFGVIFDGSPIHHRVRASCHKSFRKPRVQDFSITLSLPEAKDFEGELKQVLNVLGISDRVRSSDPEPKQK
jgi:hypothetical protein